MTEKDCENVYDIAIAGGGLAGLLSAARITLQHPDLKVLLLERESVVGGRIRSTNRQEGVWSYGLSIISQGLYQVWDQVLKDDPEAPDLASYGNPKLESIGVISAGKIQTLNASELFSAKGARAIGGAAAARDWKNLEKIKEDIASGKRKEQPFQTAWSGTHKSPAAIVLNHMAAGIGIADVWQASSSLLFAKGSSLSESSYFGNWDEAVYQLTERLQERATIDLDCDIIGAAFNDDHWSLSTRHGIYECKQLIVAQSPWDALQWLPKSYFPTELLQMTGKCKPVSIVVLSEQVQGSVEDMDLADLTFVPAEGVQILVSPNGDICYQATIDYEVSLQAPDVVKAVRCLRRARKKLLAAVPNLKTEGDHLALLPVGWTQSCAFQDRKWVSKLDPAVLNTEHLLFCGDAYGASLHGDENFVSSLLAVFAQLDQSKGDQPSQNAAGVAADIEESPLSDES